MARPTPTSPPPSPLHRALTAPGGLVLLLVLLAVLIGAGIALGISALDLPPPAGGADDDPERPEDPDAFVRWLTDSRGIEQGGIPTSRYVQAEEAVLEMLARERQLEESGDERAQILSGLGAAAEPWTWLGPSNWGGRTRALVVNPDDPSIMLAAGVTGGIWRSEDAGDSWNPLTDTFSNITVGVLEFDPNDPSVVYAGTGEAVFKARDEHRGDGIMKSTDGGVSWAFLDATTGRAEFAYVGDIEVSANDPNRVYAATGTGVWVSSDGGASWGTAPVLASGSNARSVGCLELALRHDLSPDTLLASCGSHEPDGVYRSVDAGLSWEKVLPADATPIGRTAMAIAPGRPNIVYASVTDPRTDSAYALYRSTQGGAAGTWEMRASPASGDPDWLGTCAYRGEPYAQGDYDHVIAVDPTNPDRVWLGGIDLYRSEDGGATLQKATDTRLDPNYADGTPYVHADQHVIVFHPRYDGSANRTVYFGNDGGLFATDDDRASLTMTGSCVSSSIAGIGYRSMNEGYGISQFIGGALSEDGGVVVGGTQDNGTFRLDGGRPGEWVQIWGGDGGNGAVTPDGSWVFVSNYYFYYYRLTGDAARTGECAGGGCDSANNGITDQNRIEQAAFYPPVEADSTAPGTLWTGGLHIWRTVDEGRTWVKASTTLPDVATAISIWPGDGNHVWAGTRNGALYRTTDGLAASPTWSQFASADFPYAEVSSIAVDPTNAEVAYVTFRTFDGNQLWKRSADGVWSSLDTALPDTPFNAVAVNPLNPAMVYVGTDIGIFESLDAGATWRVGNENLATTIVNRLIFRRGTSDLYAFTFGRGAYRVDVGNRAPPPNDEITAATDIVLDPEFAEQLDVRVATRSSSDPDVSCGSALLPSQGQSVWYRFQPAQDGAIEVTTRGSNYDTVAAVFSGDANPNATLTEVECNDDGVGTSEASSLVFQARTGETYFIEVTRSAGSRADTLANTLHITIRQH